MFYFVITYILVGIVLTTLLCKLVDDNIDEFKDYVGDEASYNFYVNHKWICFSILVFATPLYYTYQFIVWFIKYLFGLTLKLFGGKK